MSPGMMPHWTATMDVVKPQPDGARPSLESRKLSTPGYGFECGKRLLDIVAALVGLALLWPLLLLCGAWIGLSDRGPVLYRQWRVGRDGWLFCIYKFRTMSQDAERHGARQAEQGDPRILRGCAWMRKSHVDELPQLWNILRGDMSLVGPRPERPEIVEWLRNAVPRFDLRLVCRPGLTGLAQVRNGYTNDEAGARRKLALDLRYIRSRSIFNDLRLVLLTFPKVWDRTAL
jgi:lipopolysaccharide/colanic/teichoic acid biosynthesis glycosyltransferase